MAERALNAQPVGAQRLEVLPARHKRHIHSGRGEAASEIAADTAGAHDGETHDSSCYSKRGAFRDAGLPACATRT